MSRFLELVLNCKLYSTTKIFHFELPQLCSLNKQIFGNCLILKILLTLLSYKEQTEFYKLRQFQSVHKADYWFQVESTKEMNAVNELFTRSFTKAEVYSCSSSNSEFLTPLT